MKNLSTAVRMALVVVLIYVGYLMLLALSLPPELFKPLFSEQGPFEEMSMVLWVVLGAMLLFHDFRSPRVLALAALAFLFAGREADLHKAYTVMSIEKIKFYLSPDVPVIQKILGGIVLLGCIGLILHLAQLCHRYFYRQGGLRTPVGQVLLLPVLMLPASKIIDRFASQVYEIFGVRLPVTLGQVVSSLEEGIEMAMPVLFIVALMLYRAGRREPRADTAPPMLRGKR